MMRNKAKMVPQTTLMSERTKFSSFAADWWANQALKSGPLRLCVICLQGGIFAAVQIESGLWASENLRFDGAPFLSAPRDVLMVKVFDFDCPCCMLCCAQMDISICTSALLAEL